MHSGLFVLHVLHVCVISCRNPRPEFTWLPDSLYCCANKTICKKGEDEMDDGKLNEGAYEAACSSYKGSSAGSFAFRVAEGSGTVQVETFDASTELQFSCMKNKTIV